VSGKQGTDARAYAHTQKHESEDKNLILTFIRNKRNKQQKTSKANKKEEICYPEAGKWASTRSAFEINPGVGGEKTNLKIQSKDITLIGLYAALYAALVVVLGGFSYGPIQVRIADSLLAVVPLLGLPGVLGHTLGVFIANMFSTVGLIDLLNTIPSFAMSFVVYYVYKRTQNDYTVIGTCIAYSIVLGITVGWMLSYVLTLPLLPTMAYVAVGNIIASVLVGWPVFKVLKKIGVFQKWRITNKNQESVV
jgi:uncharacterized membrane protein